MKRKIDNRLRVLIENGTALGHRTMILLVGERSRDQVVYLHHMLSKSSLKQATVLWCYKKELVFSSHRRKRIKQLKAKMQSGLAEVNEEDPFEMFVSMTDIRYTYYRDSHKILGNTFKMVILQDFEALTPNLLCRTIETVEGGGLVVFLLQSLTSLRQLYAMSMDVHARYRTQAHQHVVPRFNERFILSLGFCPSCVVLDDQLHIFPLSSHLKDLQPISTTSAPLLPFEQELKDLKESLKDNPPVGVLISLCKTLDQAKAVLQFVLAITEKTLRTTVAMTAARGRGKSAALGISMAGAIAFGYSNIFVTSPSPENLNTLFEFMIIGLKALGYEEHLHYIVLRSSDQNLSKSVMRITVNREHRQVIQYISPSESSCLGQAELVVIDEAAAIPLPLVRQLLGPYLVFLASTVSGYEGTGRSLSLKLISQLRQQSSSKEKQIKKREENIELGRVLHEISLEESIRYKTGDSVEAWLNHLLCLEASVSKFTSSILPANQCQLFYVNRDTLFGYHKMSEKFLAKVMGLLVSSHYRNTPDDLQTLSDAPGHHLFVLLSVKDHSISNLIKIPAVLCVIQVALEGKISKSFVLSAMSEGEKPAGDLIPWMVSNQFQNMDFPQLSGVRIIRIATHPDLQRRGYGSRAVRILENYYGKATRCADFDCEPLPNTSSLKLIQDQEVGLLEEKLLPSSDALPLLQSLDERPPEALHYMGVSYGATPSLLTFWKRAGFTAVYLSQISNVITGERTIVMLKVLAEEKSARNESWLADFWYDTRKRLTNLLAFTSSSYDCKFALNILTSNIYKNKSGISSLAELNHYITEIDLIRLEEFSHHQCELSLIADLIPPLAKLYFLGKIPSLKLKPVQAAILCGVGIQRKTILNLAEELRVECSVLMSQNHFLIAQLAQHLKELWKSTALKTSDVSFDQEIIENFSTSLQRSVKVMKDRGEDDRAKVSQLIDVNQFKISSKEQDISFKRTKKKKAASGRSKKSKTKDHED